MSLWKSKRKNDYHFSVLVSAKPQWLTLMFYRNRSSGSPMCWHINLISAKWESPYRSHDLLEVDTNQNLCAKETLEYSSDVCNVGQRAWRVAVPKAGRPFSQCQAGLPQKGLLQWQAPRDMLIIKASPDACSAFLSLEFFLTWILS